MTGVQLLDVVVQLMIRAAPPDLPGPTIRAWAREYRADLLGLIEQELGEYLNPSRAARGSSAQPTGLPELWTVRQRTDANLAAMELAAELLQQGQRPTPAERRTLARYSGWGGLSLNKVQNWPEGLAQPEKRGLIHEYYTPSLVANAVARAIRPLLPTGTPLHALEPSAGIGRFLQAFEGTPLTWHAVEYSELSAAMLGLLWPDLDLYRGPFERWVRERSGRWAGQLDLVVANPPYGARGAAVTEDPDRDYREKRAYVYFLRRALDLLKADGLGVFLIPAGFLTGHSAASVAAREKVLRRHHLAAAYRLPSEDEQGRGLFPGASLVTDLLFFRARGGELAEVHESDQAILDGQYFEEHPEHILGEMRGSDDDEEGARNTYRGLQVIGDFQGLPDIEERPLCTDCQVFRLGGQSRAAPGSGRGVKRSQQDLQEDLEGLPPAVVFAVPLGLRVDAYLAALARANTRAEHQHVANLWPELHRALLDWTRRWKNPRLHVELVQHAQRGSVGAERFLAAFTRTGELIEGLQKAPNVQALGWQGGLDDLAGLAAHLYRTQGSLTEDQLQQAYKRLNGRALSHAEMTRRLRPAGWYWDGAGWDLLMPKADYLTGELWPRYDRARKHDEAQAAEVLGAIQPVTFYEIDDASPDQGWLPIALVNEWVQSLLRGNTRYTLIFEDGLYKLQGITYEDLDDKREVPTSLKELIGWLNHDRTLFNPKRATPGQSTDERRMELRKLYLQSFSQWLGRTGEAQQKLVDAYNRQFKGWVLPHYSAEPLQIARWDPKAPQLRPHQAAGARRVLTHQQGLVAFDVGVGKTFTGCAIVAQARQEGWARRPVILCPNSLVFQWEKNIRRVLPDYRIGIIGAKLKTISRGPGKGRVTSETDTPEERGRKWTEFQAGQYDVVILTYTALGRTRMNEDMVLDYAADTAAIRREIVLKVRNERKLERKDARKKGGRQLSEREEAAVAEATAAWIAEKLELPKGWSYDPGPTWDDIGIDLLVVDEAQNFKNLYMPEPREGGTPKFMGNAGEGSDRAWQLDFRCAAIRRRTGGTGIVLLSATPAKNSPLEFYSLLQLIDPRAWTRTGIRTPEAFVDRFCVLTVQNVVNSNLDVEQRLACTGFKNLPELRDVIFRYGEFKTAEDVGLKLPTPTVQQVQVDMSALQQTLYEEVVKQVSQALAHGGRGGAGASILGMLARLALIAIHPDLPEADLSTRPDTPHSPKFDAVAREVRKNQSCGHIIFVEPIAAQVWLREVLIKAGVKAERIGLLNAHVAKALLERQRIARDFNGDPQADYAPRLDVLICNQVANEGLDLQERTCAIHHVDLPWEPATLQQRNGRGVRQGNTLAAIAINYYIARGSSDAMRFSLIQGKRNWLIQLITSQDRETNNPAAQQELGTDEMLVTLSRDPEAAQAHMDKVKKKRREETLQVQRKEATRLFQAAAARFTRAFGEPPEQARITREEAERRLEDLLNTSPELWPWHAQAAEIRERPTWVTPEGAPLWEGLLLKLGSRFLEVGRVDPSGASLRWIGTARWVPVQGILDELKTLSPASYGAAWPERDESQTIAAVGTSTSYINPESWTGLGWFNGSDRWLTWAWERWGRAVLNRLASFPQTVLPAVEDGALVLRSAADLARAGLEVLPPTRAGWAQFRAAFIASEQPYKLSNTVGRFWWGLSLPMGLRSTEQNQEG